MSYNLVDPTTGELTQVAGRGRAEYGASTIRQGTLTLSGTIVPGDGTSGVVTFDTPMPDADYIVYLAMVSDYNLQLVVSNQTKTGFKVQSLRPSTASSINNPEIKWKAVRIYSDIEINDLVNYGTRFPDYAHEITGVSSPWTATQDVYVVVNIVSSDTNFDFNVDGENVLVKDISSGIGVSFFVGYIKKGSVIQWNGSLGSTVRIWPLK